MARDIPIIFSAPMVRALLDGRKRSASARSAAAFGLLESLIQLVCNQLGLGLGKRIQNGIACDHIRGGLLVNYAPESAVSSASSDKAVILPTHHPLPNTFGAAMIPMGISSMDSYTSAASALEVSLRLLTMHVAQRQSSPSDRLSSGRCDAQSVWSRGIAALTFRVHRANIDALQREATHVG